jgi:hypothetical protein
MHAMTWAIALVLALAVAAAAQDQSAPGGQTQPGNAALMDRKAEQQRRIRDEVLKALREQGRLPDNGTVSFTALAAPDPGRQGRMRIHIESLEIFPAPGSSGSGAPGMGDPARDMAQAFAPADMSRIVEIEDLDIPVGGTVRDTVTMKAGRPVFADPPVAQGK